MIYFSVLLLVHSEPYCHWILLLLRFSYMFFCTESMLLLNTLPIFWSLGFIIVLHFFCWNISVWHFFALISLMLWNHFQEEERPILIYAVTSEAVLLLFYFSHELYFIGIHLFIFLHVNCFISSVNYPYMSDYWTSKTCEVTQASHKNHIFNYSIYMKCPEWADLYR